MAERLPQIRPWAETSSEKVMSFGLVSVESISPKRMMVSRVRHTARHVQLQVYSCQNTGTGIVCMTNGRARENNLYFHGLAEFWGERL